MTKHYEILGDEVYAIYETPLAELVGEELEDGQTFEFVLTGREVQAFVSGRLLAHFCLVRPFVQFERLRVLTKFSHDSYTAPQTPENGGPSRIRTLDPVIKSQTHESDVRVAQQEVTLKP